MNKLAGKFLQLGIRCRSASLIIEAIDIDYRVVVGFNVYNEQLFFMAILSLPAETGKNLLC